MTIAGVKFGGFYRIDLKDRNYEPVTDAETLEKACMQLNGTPVEEYPMAVLNQHKIGVEHWRAVLIQGAKGPYIGMLADDRNQQAQRDKIAELEAERGFAALAEEGLGEAGPQSVEELSDTDKLEMVLKELDAIRPDMTDDEKMQAALKDLHRTPPEWFEARLPKPEPLPEVKIMRNDLADARAEFELAYGAEDDADNEKAFDRYLAEKLDAKPYLNPIDMVWKGIGAQHPFALNKSPFGDIII